MLLYKYLNVSKAKKWLMRLDGILLTPPKHFDDESEFRVRRIPANEDEVRGLFESFGGGPKFNIFEERVTSAAYLEEEPDYMRAKMSERFGVVSLCSKPLDREMWCSYAGYDGVVIGYEAIDETKVNDSIARFFEWGVIWKVDYETDPDRYVIKKDFSNIARVLTLKGLEFEFEDEWRFIGRLDDAVKHADDDKVYYTMPAYKKLIQKVIFGHEADLQFKRNFCQWLGDSDASIEEVVYDEKGEFTTRPYVSDPSSG